MNPDFWRERWKAGQIGFHQPRPTPALVRFADRLPPPDRAPRALVPLCGKTLDLRWLAERGHRVTGIEVVPEALEAFFTEQGLAVERTTEHGLTAFRGERITGIAADFFHVRPEKFGTFDLVFDRAALVALPEDVRRRYAERLLALLAPGGVMLLVSFDYDPAKMSGPPFAVTDSEVEQLYGAAGRLERLDRKELIDEEPRFRERGLDSLTESTWLLQKA
jgi:thiopurine S-methyltransferase